MLQNFLQCTEQRSAAETHPAPRISSAEVEEPCSKPGVGKLRPVGQTLFAASFCCRRDCVAHEA